VQYKIICSEFTSGLDIFGSRFGQAGDVHQFCCASQVLLLVVHAPHCDVAGILVHQIGGKKDSADKGCRLDLPDHLNESGESDMLVWSISF
jgi:hypothetical protein